jgi:Methyltransferase domain
MNREDTYHCRMAKRTAPPLDALIAPHQSVELLKELHLLTREGALNQDSRRKLKQIAHLTQFIEPLLIEARSQDRPLTLVDHGAGKSYLGFILYDLFFNAQPDLYQVFGIETRPELVTKAQALAARLGFESMRFLNLSVADAIASTQLPDQVDIVTALHACNTATDDAIAFALKKNARHVVLVPCCQAEVARFLNQGKASALASSPLSELWRRPLHTREFGSQITNVLRCLQLEAHGYAVTVTELVGWEHSLKNELIIASRKGPPRPQAAQRLRAVLEGLGLQTLEERFFVPA